MSVLTNSSQYCITRSLKTALLIDMFWDRWLVHGLEKQDLTSVRSLLTDIDQWEKAWAGLAEQKVETAQGFKREGEIKKAEEYFRKAALYYNLLQWIFPDPQDPRKHKWYELCVTYIKQADQVSSVETKYTQISVNGKACYGRIRVPKNPDGVVIIVNPIDSSKEELYSYETDFLDQGFVTVSFDGPGQGETWLRSGFRGNQRSIQSFIDGIISYTSELTLLPIFLFGTSSGASWSLYGGSHSNVMKVVAVSPTGQRPCLRLPAYFNGRLGFILDDFEFMPDYSKQPISRPIRIYHGVKDTMITPTFIQDVRSFLSGKTEIIQYEEEGHCCNYKLSQIRKESTSWFKDNK